MRSPRTFTTAEDERDSGRRDSGPRSTSTSATLAAVSGTMDGVALPQAAAPPEPKRSHKRRAFRMPRRFPPTREGWWFLVATLLVGAAAVNAGLNLLFLVFGMMLFLILASGVMSELCLRDLTVSRQPPTAVHAGTPFLMGIAVRNDKQRVPTFSLEVEDLVHGRPVERRCYFLKIPAGRRQETAYRHVLPRRGVHRLTGFRLSTRFPFGLIRKSRDVDQPTEILVYPALVPVSERLVAGLVAERNARHANRPSRAGEFHGLRELRPGDDPRHVHWRSSARRGKLLVRENEDETGRELVVELDGGGGLEGAAFEQAVSLAASLALRLLRQGVAVGLSAGGELLAPSASGNQATEILRRLALVQPRDEAPELAAAERRGRWPRVVVRAGAERPNIELVGGEGSRRSA